MMRDRREPLKKGTCINIGGGEYIVDECISSGGQALIYRCHLKEYQNAQRYILKEYYPPEAVRENGVIVEGPEWKYRKRHSLEYYYKKVKKAEENVTEFGKRSHQAQFVSEVIPDDGRMVALMRMASDDCKTIKKKLEEWYSGNISFPKSQPDLYRVQEGVKIIKGVLTALIMLHGESCGGIVHRDLTPGNILIAESSVGANTEYTIYPIDFSCSAPIGSPFDSEMSVSPGYTHPVLYENSHLLDLYSVAALLLVLVTGTECLHRVDNWEVNNLIIENHFYIDEALTTLNIPLGVKRKLESVLKRAVSMRSADQYSSAKEMYTELETLEEIIDCRGMHPEVLFDASATEFREQCKSRDGVFRYKVEPDLVTEAIDCESNQPINLLGQNTILLGSGGTGKTTKIRTLWEDCLENWYADRENSPIPIFVPVNTFDSSKDGEDFIKSYIATRYFPQLSKDDGKRCADLMGMLRSRGRYVLFLDGINEAVGNDKLNAEIADFAAIENVAVLITSRNDWGDDETKKLFSTAELLPLNNDLILRKLRENSLGSPSARLLETLRRPMFLALYLRIKITGNAVETPGQILFAHHKHLIDAYKTGHHRRDTEERFVFVVDYILPRLATEINNLQFDYNELYDTAEVIYADAVAHNRRFKKLKSNEMDIADLVDNVLHECGILRKFPAINNYVPDTYVFSHQIYLEFYQALDVYNQMAATKEGEILPDALSAGILPDAVIHFLGDILGEYEFQTKTDCNGNLSPIEEWLQRNCANRGDYPAQIAIRNLIETMKISTDKQLQKRCFRNLDLTLTNFYDCNLRGSDFSCSKIGDATFICQGHDNPIDELLVIPEKKWILSSSSVENYIYIWDAETGAQVGFVGGNNVPLSAFSVSADKKTIITDEFYHVAIYSLENREKMPCGRIDYSALEEDSSKEIHEPQNYKWLSADNREVFFAIRGSRKLGVDQLEESALAKCINKTASAYFSFDHPIQCCEMSADYSHLYITLSNGELWIWDTKQKTCLTEKKYIVPCNANRLAVDPCERYALLRTDTNELFEINLHTGTSNKVNADVSLLKDDDKLLFATASRYYLWYDGNSLFSVDRDNQKFANMSITGITSMYLDWENDKVYLGSSRGEIKVADAKTLRVLSTLDCGERNDWRKPHNFVPHWYDGGLARITKHNRIQCLTSDGFKMLQVSNIVCNCFDGNYHICLVEEKNSKFSLVISDLCGGTVVENIPFENLCKAYNTKGEEIFGVYSEFNWVKYFPQKGKVIVNYSAGLLKCWDVNECVWHSIGYWDREVEQILSRYDCFEPNDWEMIEESLADISMRNHIFGNHIVQGTSSGHLLWWDFDGNLCRDDHPHRRSTKIYPVPDSMFFITEGVDFVRCIWNWETMELIDSDRRKIGAKRGVVLKVLHRQDILPALRNNHENMQFWYEYLEHMVLICCKLDEYHDLKSVNCKKDVVVYTTNDYICVCNLYDEKRDDKYLLRTFKTLLTEDVDSWVNYSLSDNDLLAIAFADGTVKVFDIHQNATMFYCPDSEWYVTSAVDVSECKFNQATVKGWIEYPLLMNGACFDNESAQHSLRMHNWVRLFEQQKTLRKEIDEDPYDEEKWIRLFSDFGSNMSGKELRHLIHDLQENFDDTGMRRAVFGNAIDDIYSDEENMLNSIPKTTDGLQTLCRYLSKHLECEYGFNMLFDDFGNVLDADARTSMKELLLGNFNLDYLKWTYPHEFGYPDLDDEDMYDKDHLLYDDEIF